MPVCRLHIVQEMIGLRYEVQGLSSDNQSGHPDLPPLRGHRPDPRDREEIMPWILCRKCSGTQIDPDDEDGEEACPACADSSNPGHIFREYLA
jgi:hypothetical protein